LSAKKILGLKYNRELLESIVMAVLSQSRIPVLKFEKHLRKDLHKQIELDRESYIFNDDKIKAQKVKERLLFLLFSNLI
jgi:hypothetical protein